MDLSARIAANKLSTILGQPIVVVNKPGGGSVLGISYVATSRPDGYTLLWTAGGGGSFELMPVMMAKRPYQVTDFIPIAGLVEFSLMAAVNKDVPVKTLAELGDYIKKNPGKLSCSTPGIGSLPHLLAEWFRFTFNVEQQMEIIPYNSMADTLQAVLGNHSQVMFLPILSLVTKHINVNELRALAVFSPKRDRLLPSVPTAIEQGFKDMNVVNHYAIYAPAKTPAQIISKIEKAMQKVAQDKELQEKLQALDLTVSFKDSQRCLKLQNESINKWSLVIKRANIVIK